MTQESSSIVLNLKFNTFQKTPNETFDSCSCRGGGGREKLPMHERRRTYIDGSS